VPGFELCNKERSRILSSSALVWLEWNGMESTSLLIKSTGGADHLQHKAISGVLARSRTIRITPVMPYIFNMGLGPNERT